MSFRARLAIVAATAVALAVIAASVAVYVVVRNQLRGTVDDALRDRATQISHSPLRAIQEGDRAVLDAHELGGAPGYLQVVQANGTTIRPPNEDIELPVSAHVLAVANGKGGAFFSDTHVSEVHVRVFTIPGSSGFAVQIARPLTEVDHSLGRIRFYLLLIALGGSAVAATLGLAVTRAAVAPVRRLTEASERVTETGDLSERIESSGQDELSRLASSFNTMLGALEQSTQAQRQLVADASHELRTPLTSLRTNIEVLAGEHRLPDADRKRLLTDVVEELGEMTTLISELIELARGDQPIAEPEDVRLDLLAAGAVDRVKRSRPNVTFKTSFEESMVHGDPATIERAVSNLLDNAAKWSPPGADVDVQVEDGVVTIRDRGPGIAEEDLPFIFDRFYRARSARGMPGSGLGLAIVRQVALAHGGEVRAEAAEGGGTRIFLRLNGNQPPGP
jgi:two-component system sensor histidine kinase MprB